MANNPLHSILVLIALFYLGKGQISSLDRCPMFGCRPSGTFSYVLEMTSKVGMAWPRSFIQGPLTNSLGCVADDVNIVCQASGLQHEGYVSLFPDTGMASWYADVLKKPSLPNMNINGTIFGTDGHNLIMFDSKGNIVGPQINLGKNLYPTYSLTLSEENGIIAIVSRQGYLVTRESNGDPHAALQFRAEVERTNGTFLPVAPPVVSGHRIYILTEFRPDYDVQEPNILGMQRLFAIDINQSNVTEDRLKTAWVYNFENLGSTSTVSLNGENHEEVQGVLEANSKVSASGPTAQVMVNSNTNMVYVNLPPPEGVTNSLRLVYGFKDETNGTSPNIIFKTPLALSNFAMFESNSGNLEAPKRKRDSNNSHKLEKHEEEASIWGVSIDRKQILKLNPNDGTVLEQIELNSVLNMTSSIVTSKLMVARKSGSTEDILIFGGQANAKNENDLTNNNSETTSAQNFVVSLVEEKVNWIVMTPTNKEVKGQIAGVRQPSINAAEMLVVFTSDSQESEIFGITSY